MTTALAIGPANYAGQATAWARAVTRQLGSRAWSFSRTAGYAFPVDRTLPPRAGVGQPRTSAFDEPVLSVIDGATHVALDGFLALTGSALRGSVNADLDDLIAMGLRTALIAHGSDVRDPVSHARRVPHSWFRGGISHLPYVASHVAYTARNRRIAATADSPIFVTTPDLLHELPDAIWLPATIDTALFATSVAPFATGGLPRVLHLPSRTTPPIKGTDAIDAVVKCLARERLVEYVRPEQVTSDQVPALLADVDIVIDQVRSDAYGAIAVEALAAGRIVIGSVLGSRELLSEDPPILDATPDTLERVLREVLSDRDRALSVAAHGPGYAERWHNGAGAAAALAGFLSS